MDSAPRRPSAAARAFSLIELLVVVGIIVILLSISIAVGFRVSGSGKVRQTEQILNVLDQALSAYVQANEGNNPKPYVIDPRRANQANQLVVQPVMDGVIQGSPDPIQINSIGFFLAQCKDFPEVYAKFTTLPSGALKDFDIDSDENNPHDPSDYRDQPELPTIFDAWDNPIRYVHPAFAGVRPADGSATYVTIVSIFPQPPMINGVAKLWGIQQVRRTGPPFEIPGDSDGGIPPGAQPYFYSCGPDGDPSTLDDNVYVASKQPRTNRQ